MEQTTLGIGTRLQHTHFGPGVIVGIRYATYLISFINHGIKEIDKTDNKLEEIIPENVSANPLGSGNVFIKNTPAMGRPYRNCTTR